MYQTGFPVGENLSIRLLPLSATYTKRISCMRSACTRCSGSLAANSLPCSPLQLLYDGHNLEQGHC